MKTVVIGGGASGLMSAYFQAKTAGEVVLIEQNEKVGKKIYITGKGRCNVTNDSDNSQFLSNVVTNPKFLMSSINAFSCQDCMDFFEKYVHLKVERGNRVFPMSDKSSDIIKCLLNYCERAGVEIKLNTTVKEVIKCDGQITAVRTDKEVIECQKVIIATGGASYSQTGSTGDGYKFAKQLGHTIMPLKPALVGLNLKGDFYKQLQGVSLKNVELSTYRGGKLIYKQFGEMLFTHFGMSGPIVLSTSSIINKEDLSNITIKLDLKPALTEEQLDNRILRDFEKYKNKMLKNSLDDLLLKSLIPVIIQKSKISAETKNNVISKEQRLNLIKAIKAFEIKVSSLRDKNEGIITSGGVNVKEINPKTMESKIVKGLYFAGEVIDVDALTGGFNLQIAFATGKVAGGN